MALELQPFTEFGTTDLSRQLRAAVRENQALLEQRYIFGPIHRYGNFLNIAANAVNKGKIEHERGMLGHFAVVGESGDVVGAASIHPELRLRKLRVPLPPKLAFGLLARDFEHAKPNISAWAGEDDDLQDVYRDLLDRSRDDTYHYGVTSPDGHRGSAWTVEPSRSPLELHQAIEGSGLTRVADKFFDDQEMGGLVPPVRRLYADIQFEWDSSWGQMKELATGMKGYRGFFDELENEMISRNPKGG